VVQEENLKSLRWSWARNQMANPKYIGLLFCLLTIKVAAFPIDEFKYFINTKPTIEKFAFRLKSSKYVSNSRIGDVYRPFVFVFQENKAFSLVEDRRKYDPFIKINFDGQFENQYWRRFNSNDFVTAQVDRPSQRTGIFDPQISHIGIALDALNFGIQDLWLNRVTWEGNNFTGSNMIGARIEGQIALGPQDVPIHLALKYIFRGVSYNYRTSYEFDKSRGLPEFFPSRIKVDYIDGSKTSETTDYQIDTAVFSGRELTLADVNYTNLIDTNSLHFISTNAAFFVVQNKENGLTTIEPVPHAK